MLTGDTGKSWFPSIAVANGVVHLVWVDTRDGPNGEIYHLRSTDNGITWSSEMRMSFDTARSEYPCIGTSGSDVHLVWRDNRDSRFSYEIYYRKSTDGGITWSSEIRLTTASGIKWDPAIAVAEEVVHLVWGDNRDGEWNVYYKRSTDRGETWGSDVRLTDNVFAQQWPCVAVDDSIVVVAWQDNEDVDGELWCRFSFDRGETWEEPVRVSSGSAQPGLWSPSICFSKPNIHLVWPDGRDGNFEIYYARSSDLGQTWEEVRLTQDDAVSNYPSVCSAGDMVHIVWTDFRDGPNGEIYYKRNPTGNSGIKESKGHHFDSQRQRAPFNFGSEKRAFDISGRLVMGQKTKDGVYFVYSEAGWEKVIRVR